MDLDGLLRNVLRKAGTDRIRNVVTVVLYPVDRDADGFIRNDAFPVLRIGPAIHRDDFAAGAAAHFGSERFLLLVSIRRSRARNAQVLRGVEVYRLRDILD